MPVIATSTLRILDQGDFAAIAYEVLQRSYTAHRRLGRFFDEDVYQSQIQETLGPRVSSEVQIQVSHGDFLRSYRMGLLVDGAAWFDLKAVDCLCEQHRSQLLRLP